eukprot:1536246-Rhodomonas_salina.3
MLATVRVAVPALALNKQYDHTSAGSNCVVHPNAGTDCSVLSCGYGPTSADGRSVTAGCPHPLLRLRRPEPGIGRYRPTRPLSPTRY